MPKSDSSQLHTWNVEEVLKQPYVRKTMTDPELEEREAHPERFHCGSTELTDPDSIASSAEHSWTSDDCPRGSLGGNRS
jgi:hypothetical protein